MNITLNLGDGAPRWLIAALLTLTFAAELLEHLPKFWAPTPTPVIYSLPMEPRCPSPSPSSG